MIDINEVRQMTRASREAAERAIQKKLRKETDNALAVACAAITKEAQGESYFAYVYIGDGLFLTPDNRPVDYIEVAPAMVERLADRLKEELRRLGFVVTSDKKELSTIQYTRLKISWEEP